MTHSDSNDASQGRAGPLSPSDVPRLQEELRAAQEQYGRLLGASSDPLRERDLAGDLAAVRRDRDQLLDDLGRVLLKWIMDGGGIELTRGGHLRRTARRPAAPRSPEPPSAEEEDSAPSSPPAEAADLAALVQRGVGPSWTSASQTTPEPPDLSGLGPLVRELHTQADPPDEDDFVETELERLVLASREERVEIWRALPREAQRAVVGLVTARARHLQDERELDLSNPDVRADLDGIFSTLTSFSKREQPGFVFGLMRSHSPVADSWWSDARRWWRTLADLAPDVPSLNPERALDAFQEAVSSGGDAEAREARLLEVLEAGVTAEDPRLVTLVMDQGDILARRARFKRLRKAVRDALEADMASEQDLRTPGPDEDWPHWELVRGKRAAIIGGDSREHARVRIQDAFELSDTDWITTDHSRNLQTLRDAVEGGRYDLVIVLRRFIGHDVDRIVLPACKSAEVPWVSVDRGYGITQVQQAFERFLPQ